MLDYVVRPISDDASDEAIAHALKAARRANHPDVRGDRVSWHKVEEAAKVIGALR